jgi:gliding motility-associated-like protein
MKTNMLANLSKSHQALFSMEPRMNQLKNNLYRNMNTFKSFAVAVMMLFAITSAYAQTVTVTVVNDEVCSGQQTSFQANVTGLPSGVTVTGYVWNVPSQPNGNTTQNTYTFAYPAGDHTVTVTANLSNSSSITSNTATFKVFHLPNANLTVTSTAVQCFRGNSFIFTNSSTQNTNTPSNPLDKFDIGYGDGIINQFPATTTTFTHTYNSAGSYAPFVRVYDSKGCFKDFFLAASAIIVKPNIAPDFKWTFKSGPCFISCYQFKNQSLPSPADVNTYKWDFGDGNSLTGTGSGNPLNYDTITHCYQRGGRFNPALIITDNTFCTDSTRMSPINAKQPLPENVVFEFDVVTRKGGSGSSANNMKDSVCFGSGNATEICYSMTPVELATPGTGDFVWNFGDPNDPNNRNRDSSAWKVCHTYSGMGHFNPRITIKNICPDTTFFFYSAVSTSDPFDLNPFLDNDLGPNPTPPPGINSGLFTISNPLDLFDSVTLTYTSVQRLFNNPPINENLHAYLLPSGDTVFFRQQYPIVDGSGNPLPSVKIPQSFMVGFKSINYRRTARPSGTRFVAYRPKFQRPVFFFTESAPFVQGPAGSIKDTMVMSWHLLNAMTKRGYGVYVIGPRARIENPPAMITLAPNHKRQCDPRDTVDFVNTSVYYKSRKIWRRWDFDDNFAPECTSFSRPKPGFPPATGWANAQQQYLNSDHFWILNKIIRPGRMHCKWSFDTLPRHKYPSWDSIYLWYRYGKDFMPWNLAQFGNGVIGNNTATGIRVAPWDEPWWGKTVYLNIATGYWSLHQDSTLMNYEIIQVPVTDPISGLVSMEDRVFPVNPPKWVKWPRIDNLALRQNAGADLTGTPNPAPLPPGSFTPIMMQNVPSPMAVERGRYPYINWNLNGMFDGKTNIIQVDPSTGDSWTVSPFIKTNTGDSMYRYVFKRSIQRCITVRMKLKDTANNESSDLGMHHIDSLVLDDKDCEHENQVQLAFGVGDAFGLGLSGKICPGSSRNNFGAQIRLNMGAMGQYPGVVPNCGQSFIMLNLDSTADRRDLTPCDIDGFTSWQGGITPGGLVRPTFNTGADYPPFPPFIWQNPNGTVNVYHYDPAPGAPIPLPADELGWVTIGVAIGNGSKDTILTNVPLSQYKLNPGGYQNYFQPPRPPGVAAPVYSPVSGIWVTGGNFPPAATGANYNYRFSHLYNYRPVTLPTIDTLVDIIYIDNALPKCVSNVVWYHRFMRIIDVGASFLEFPASCFHRGKGDSMTVFYTDSVQDSIRYTSWQWADNTVTVDSFWYAGAPITNGFYHNGVRRVRYNFDMISGTAVLMDSTVFPIRASGPGATDGLKPREKFAVVEYDTLDFCTNTRVANPPTYIVDTALMMLPISHKFIRSSWEAQTVEPDKRSVTPTIHLIATTAECQSIALKYMPVGVIDTFETKRDGLTGPNDSVFCENETVYFYDSVRYWRYDCNLTVLPDNPGRTRPRGLPVQVFDPNTDPRAFLQIDPYDFWRQAEFDPNQIRDSFTTTQVFYNKVTGQYDTLKRRGAIFSERMYWNFGDGFTYQGTRPSHKYQNFGRYKVTMVTMDSLGWYDTCVRWVNIVKPVARIGSSKPFYACSEIVRLYDSSYIDFGTGPNTTDDLMAGGLKMNWWWFGENTKDTITPQALFRDSTQQLYRSNGKFRVKLAIQTQQGCVDTAYKDIFINGPRPRYRIISDTVGCAPFKIKLINLADSLGMRAPGDTPTRETQIYWGDGNFTDSITVRGDTVEYTYLNEGVYSITAVGRDALFPTPVTCALVYYPDTVDGLMEAIKVRILKFGAELLHDTAICVGEPIQLFNRSDSNFTRFRYDLYNPATQTSTLLDSINYPAQRDYTSDPFNTAGLYQVISTPIRFSSQIPPAAYPNCLMRDTVTVKVSEAIADFDIDSTNVPKFSFINKSSNAVAYEWTLYKEDGTVRTSKQGNINDPDFRDIDLGQDKGTYLMCLKAITADSLGSCEDTVCKPIINQFSTKIKIFNVFTPGGEDTQNDRFWVEIEGHEKFEIFIYNRWGGKVFESTNPQNPWDGSNMNDGSQCPAGVYYYIINYKLKAEGEKSVNGTVTLIR